LGGARGQASDIEIQAREILYLKKRLNEMLAYHTGKPIEVIQKATDRDNYLNPEEAIELGLIDKIVKKHEAK
jgi:ATP-dependent Clp protease protease subunit